MDTDRSARILLVDDDRRLSALLCKYLEENGYRVTVAGDGSAMRRALQEAQADLLLLDVMLPGEDGFTLCRALRMTSQLPIIMLSALAGDEERIRGIEAGADDYLVKPFNPRELLGRIRAVLRRASKSAQPRRAREIYRFGDWRLETASRRLTHADGRSKLLAVADFRLLVLLLSHPMQVLSRAQLMESLHGRDVEPLDRSIDASISRLRHALEDNGNIQHLIKTVYGTGYVFSAVVQAD